MLALAQGVVDINISFVSCIPFIENSFAEILVVFVLFVVLTCVLTIVLPPLPIDNVEALAKPEAKMIAIAERVKIFFIVVVVCLFVIQSYATNQPIPIRKI
jgi:hypothetical protein